MSLRLTSDYLSQIYLRPEGVLGLGAETNRTTVPGETRTLAETIIGDTVDYVRGTLGDPRGGGGTTLNNNQIENAVALLTILSAAEDLGLGNGASDHALILSLLDTMVSYHRVQGTSPNWGSDITASRSATEIMEFVVKYTAELSPTVLTKAGEMIADVADDNLTPSYQLRDGVDFAGDGNTASESMSWAAGAVQAAIWYLPAHANVGTWTAALPDLLAATYAVVADGITVSGSNRANVYTDFYPGAGYEVENHKLRPHPRYEISGIQSLGRIRRLAATLGEIPPTMPHADTIYTTVVTRRYREDGGIRFPFGDDSARRSLMNWVVVDLIAAEAEWADTADCLGWARCRLSLMRTLQTRGTHTQDGRMYEDIDLIPGASRTDQEYRVAQQVAQVWQELQILATRGVT